MLKNDLNFFIIYYSIMVDFKCDICGRTFSKKSSLLSHKNRKTPCKKETDTEFRETSENFNKLFSKEERLEQGIFFTPKKARDILFSKLVDLINPKTILEPSFGSGEFILDARRIYPKAKIFGVEKNEKLFKSVKCSNSTLSCCDFLTWTGKADLIIGNPPYFICKIENKEKYAAAMTGRPNMYILFLYKCLEEHLENDGFLAFIIPTSLYNCSYYQPMRDYIKANTTIHYLETLNKPGFYETGQETLLIILQKKKMNDDYIFTVGTTGQTYISPFYKELYELTKDSKSLSDLGLGVKTGNIVWNQVKENMVNEGTLLIYSSNIKNNELVLDNLGGTVKKQYIKGLKNPTLDGPVILVERGYGNSYNFNYVLVNLKDFYAENHINVIYPKTPEVIINLEKVATSFKDEKTKTFIKLFIGNGSVSSKDLETIVPIFEQVSD